MIWQKPCQTAFIIPRWRKSILNVHLSRILSGTNWNQHGPAGDAVWPLNCFLQEPMHTTNSLKFLYAICFYSYIKTWTWTLAVLNLPLNGLTWFSQPIDCSRTMFCLFWSLYKTWLRVYFVPVLPTVFSSWVIQGWISLFCHTSLSNVDVNLNGTLSKMNEEMNKLMNEWIDEWMNEWMNGWKKEWMNEWMNHSTVRAVASRSLIW